MALATLFLSAALASSGASSTPAVAQLETPATVKVDVPDTARVEQVDVPSSDDHGSSYLVIAMSTAAVLGLLLLIVLLARGGERHITELRSPHST